MVVYYIEKRAVFCVKEIDVLIVRSFDHREKLRLTKTQQNRNDPKKNEAYDQLSRFRPVTHILSRV